MFISEQIEADKCETIIEYLEEQIEAFTRNEVNNETLFVLKMMRDTKKQELARLQRGRF